MIRKLTLCFFLFTIVSTAYSESTEVKCTDRSSTKVLGVHVNCANKFIINAEMKRIGLKKLAEYESQWVDIYDSKSVKKNSTRLGFFYTKDGDLAVTLYELTGVEVHSVLTSVQAKYGAKTSREWDPKTGTRRYEMTLMDGIKVIVRQNGEDSPVNLSYVNPVLEHLRKSQLASQK